MPLLAQGALVVAAACLVAATLAALADLLTVRGDRRVVVQSLAGSGFLLLAVFLGSEALVRGWFPAASAADVLAWVALGSVAGHLACIACFRVRALAPFLLPLAAACALSAAAAGNRPWGSTSSVQAPWTLWHGLSALLGEAAFALAFAAGALYLVQAARLKSDPARASRLPSLETLDRLNLWGLLLALPFWTLALVAGVLKAPGFTPLVLISACTWMALAWVTAIRLTATARGRKVALLSITTFLLSLAVMFGGHLGGRR